MARSSWVTHCFQGRLKPSPFCGQPGDAQSSFVYHKLQVAFDALRTGARLVATNPDRYCPVPGGGEPNAAAIIAAIEACTGTVCDPIVGKPSPIMV